MATQKVLNFPDNKKEIWKPIKGYEGIYEASTKGRVRSIDRTIRYKSSNQYSEFYKEEFKKGKVLSPGDNGKGYKQVNLSKENNPNVVCVHRLVAETFIPNPENKRTVNHIDGDKYNNHIENLQWVSYSENISHAYETSLIKQGNNHHFSKLCEDNIREIRRKYKGDQRKSNDGITMKEIADEYDVSREHIGNIIRRKKWKHVK